MKKLDAAAFVHGWPFHHVRCSSLADIRRLHERSGIEDALISSSASIFYNDPLESEQRLSRELCNSGYRQLLTVNPKLPGVWELLAYADREPNIAGIRLFPGFHGYRLTDPCVQEVTRYLRERNLPLFLTLRMEDERVAYLFYPETIPMSEVNAFLAAETGFPVVLSNIRGDELLQNASELLARPNTFADTCGFKDHVAMMEELYAAGLCERLVYGSLTPLFCLQSTLLVLKTAEIPLETREAILCGKALEPWL